MRKETTLSPYRVLDLSDEKAFICGKVFGELGADVIKVEKPGGDPARNRGPFYHDIPQGEKSLYWFAYNSGKRGITLDLEKVDGREIFRKLVKTADFLIESFEPGYMDGLGLGYEALSKLNPGLILISITGFGQKGPYAHYKAPDLVVMAMGGAMYVCGDADRPPVRVNEPQSYCNAGVEGVVAGLMALWYRHQTGEGQHVDVSAQQCIYWTLTNTTGFPSVDRTGLYPKRAGMYRIMGPMRVRVVYPCQGGYVAYFPTVGVDAAAMYRLVEWMDSEGMAGVLKGEDWSTWNMQSLTPERVGKVEEDIARFFMAHTKQEIHEQAVRRGLMLYPCNTPPDMIEDPQLKAREYFLPVEHPELADTILYPGAFARMSEAPWVYQRRPPLIGEHNEEVYGQLLGLSKGELLTLKQGGVI